MHKFDPRQFKLLKRSPAGKVSTKEITTDSVQVEPGSAYTVVDAKSDKLPANMRAKRVGQDLHIEVDGHALVRLEGFYAPGNGNTAFDGSGELFSIATGQYDTGYALVTGDPVGTSDKVLIGPGEEGGGGSALWWGGAIALGGVAVAAGAKSGGGTAGTGSGGGTGSTGSTGGAGSTGGTGSTSGSDGTGNTSGTSGTGSKDVPPLILLSNRAGIVGPESLALAKVQIRYDANADGRIDSTELQPALLNTITTSGSSTTTRGQFRLDTISSVNVDPTSGVLQFTSTGGTANVLFNEVAVSGPVEYLAYVTRPITDSPSAFQVVLSPLTTLGSNLFRNQLQLGKPTGFNLDRAYTENLSSVTDALGISMPVNALMSTSPERSPTQRLVVERQVNALLDVLVSLSSGKSDASAAVASANASADMGYRLANHIIASGGLGLTDATELRNTLVSVLPKSAPIADALSGTLEKLMRALSLSNDGDDTIAQAATKVLPQLSGTLAAMKDAMLNGTLDDAALQSNLNSSLSRITVDLDSALKMATPSAYARVLMTSDGKDVKGAFIDRNMDGQLNADDKLNGNFVAADFGAGKNADPAANRVVITYLNVPGAIPTQLPATLTSNDRVSFNLDSKNFTDANKVQNLNLEWSALDSSADARALKTLQSSGLKPDLSLTARGLGSLARLSMGKLGNPSESITATTALT